MAFYTSILVYIPNEPITKVRVGVKTSKVAKIEVKVLFLIKTFLANLSFLTKKEIRWPYKPIIQLTSGADFMIIITSVFLNNIANILSLKLLEL